MEGIMARMTLVQQAADIGAMARELTGHAFDDMALGRHANWEDTIAGVIPAPGTQAYADKYASPAIQAMLLGTDDFTPRAGHALTPHCPQCAADALGIALAPFDATEDAADYLCPGHLAAHDGTITESEHRSLFGWDAVEAGREFDNGITDQERDLSEESYNRAFCGACGASPCTWDGATIDGFHRD